MERQVQSLQGIFKNWRLMTNDELRLVNLEDVQILDNFLRVISQQERQEKQQQTAEDDGALLLEEDLLVSRQPQISRRVEETGSDLNGGTQTNFREGFQEGSVERPQVDREENNVQFFGAANPHEGRAFFSQR